MMIPINNSDTAWLVVSDYNQDNGKYYEELREDIISPNVNDWVADFHTTFNNPENIRKRTIYIGYGGEVGGQSSNTAVGWGGVLYRGGSVGSASEIGNLIGGI